MVLFTFQFSQNIFKMCDVTRSNFEEKCPVILESIRHCSFIAFDAEFTVLKANDACTSRYSISKSFKKSKKSHFFRFLQLYQKRQKNSWKLVYILTKQCRTPFNLTNFLTFWTFQFIWRWCEKIQENPWNRNGKHDYSTWPLHFHGKITWIHSWNIQFLFMSTIIWKLGQAISMSSLKSGIFESTSFWLSEDL